MSIWDAIGGFINRITGRQSADEKRNQAKLVRDQMDAYKKQTAIAEEEIRRKQSEQEAEKRKIDEKQIRGLRNRYRPAGGILNQRRGGESGLATESGQPTKLGG